MLMKMFDKGQVVIPVAIRNALGVKPGDLVDVVLDEKEHCVKLKKQDRLIASELAGSLSKYNKREKFPSNKEMKEALAEGLSDGSI